MVVQNKIEVVDRVSTNKEASLFELVRFLKENYEGFQTFFTHNMEDDEMILEYLNSGIRVYLCKYWGYLEVYGIDEDEQDYLRKEGFSENSRR